MKKRSVLQISVTAFCAAINIAGGYLALVLRLPVYLDSIGTILAAALLGPFGGSAAGMISAFFSGITTDIYALYFAPVQILTGLAAGWCFQTPLLRRKKIPAGTLLVSLPGTLAGACISAYLFGGVTSSGSSVLVVLFHKLGMNLVASAFAVQGLTDYADRLLSVCLVTAILAGMPPTMKMQIRKGKSNGAL